MVLLLDCLVHLYYRNVQCLTELIYCVCILLIIQINISEPVTWLYFIIYQQIFFASKIILRYSASIYITVWAMKGNNTNEQMHDLVFNQQQDDLTEEEKSW